MKGKEWLSEAVFDKGWEEYGSDYVIKMSTVMSLIDEMDDLQEVPDYVADWLDDNMDRYENIYSFIISLVETWGSVVPDDVSQYASEYPDNMGRAYLFGYQVEKEIK